MTSGDLIATDHTVLADGINGITYSTKAGSAEYDHFLTPRPPYPTSAEDETTRLYLFTSAGEVPAFNDALTLTVKHVKRFAAVQGGV